MTVKEFLAWLEGFEEGFATQPGPTRRQYDRIKDKLNNEMALESMEYGAFLHRYYTPYAEIWNQLGSEDQGEPVEVNPDFVLMLLFRNWKAAWKIAGRAEFLSINPEH
jgi:hypothetical protein